MLCKIVNRINLLEVKFMSYQHPVINANFDDRIVFISTPKKGGNIDIKEALSTVKGTWKNHPIFAKLIVKKIIELLRGPDSDV